MSYIDLATLTMHRRNELDSRIDQFTEKCDQAISKITKLKTKAKAFVSEINCEPSELKERFLNCMKALDEYTYVITDINLAVGKLEETSSVDYTPVQDGTAAILPAVPLTPFNLLDALSEPTPSTSSAPTNLYNPQKPRRIKTPKEDQLIAFSSASCSSESVPHMKQDTVAKEIQCQITEDLSNMLITDRDQPSPVNVDSYSLPAQTILEIDQKIDATIMHVDGAYFWVVADVDEIYRLMTEMTQYYCENKIDLSLEEVNCLHYVAFYDDECYYRGLFLGVVEKDDVMVEMFAVDTGERRHVSWCEVQPLAPQFYAAPPYARCCHLAGINLSHYQDEDLLDAFSQYMKKYVGIMCEMHIDDNTSESLGVYVKLPNKKNLNEIIINAKLGYAIDKEESLQQTVKEELSPAIDLDPDLDISQCPEYDDPVEAVTGYHNRDEADICKHYKGGPAKTCYKGTKCTKKHIVKHPDGWTLDRVEVSAKCKPLPPAAPGSWLRVRVTCVCHYDRLYVQFVHDDKHTEEIPDFGVILPPTTLEGLIKDMNSPAARMSYKPLKISPAVGEMVAALFPLDGNWYRARVVSVTRADQNVEVVFVDYGTTMWVKEDQVKVLEGRHHALPMQAVRCVLAGVRAASHRSDQWAVARDALAERALNRTLLAHVIARNYDEMTVELFDNHEYSIAEQLAALKLVELTEYEVEPDTNLQQKLIVP